MPAAISSHLSDSFASHAIRAAEAANAANSPDQTQAALKAAGEKDDSAYREAFDAFVGETFYAMLLKSMRKTVGETPYFHGGRGEEIFRTQLDQMLAERMAKADGANFTGPMFELLNLPRP